MSSSSIVHFAAPHEVAGSSVEGVLMPTTFAYAYAGPPGRPSQPGNGNPPCPPRNPHCIPEPSGFVMVLLAVGFLVALRLTRGVSVGKMNQTPRKGE